ncbi:type VII secretion protein EccE [Gordonia sp. CPCC 206044]|uniref:type VII secretion protein EccE n=1 Tax=Gordonia sp. CPCC 206044 TaxID=3140793 RepID=UPI003AF35F1B
MTIPDAMTGRAPRLPAVVAAQTILAAGLLAWSVSGSRWGAVALVVAGCLIAPVAGRRHGDAGRWYGRLRFAWTRSRRRVDGLAPPPFDIPIDTGSGRRTGPHVAADPDSIGARWAGDTLITVIRVAPGSSTLTWLTPESASVADPSGQFIPLHALADSLCSFEIRLASIDVIGHGIRTWGTDRIAQIYHRTLGPLAATAHRTVLVVIRLNPSDCPDAIRRRGGGAVGAMRTATVATRRVAARLAAGGLKVSMLSAAEIAACTELLADGVRISDMAEHRESVDHRHLRFRSAMIDPTSIVPILDTVWANAAVSTTITLRLRADPDGTPVVGGLVRFAELPSAGRTVDAWPAGLTGLPDHQFDALAAGLPIGAAGDLDRRLLVSRGTDADALLHTLRFPAGGCGQLVGADRVGRAVAVPLFAPAVESVTIVAGRHLLGQVLLRAIAVGASVTVHTVSPARWHRLVESVGDPSRLGLHPDRAPTHGHRVAVYDGLTAPPPLPGTTHVIVVDPDDADPDDTPVDHVAPGALVLREIPGVPQEIRVITADTTITVTVVATAAEWALTAT